MEDEIRVLEIHWPSASWAALVSPLRGYISSFAPTPGLALRASAGATQGATPLGQLLRVALVRLGSRSMTRLARLFGLLLVVAAASGCNKTAKPDPVVKVPVENWSFKFVDSMPHDRTDYTQGLVYRDGVFFESTGQYGESKLRKVRPRDGASLKKLNLAREYFGEGVAEVNGRLYQLTWKAGHCFVYDKETFEVADHFKYEGEGWGLTHDGTQFVMSNGTAELQFRDTATFEVTKRVTIYRNGVPQRNLNELEFVDGLIYANIYNFDFIAVIDPAQGAVVAKIDCKLWLEKAKRLHRRSEVLNGIAHNPESGNFYITGKDWPILYELELVKEVAAQ